MRSLNPRDDVVDIGARLRALARVSGTEGSVVSVYLNTRWADEQQRERVRIFLKDELGRVRARTRDDRLLADLAWIEEQAAQLVDQASFPDADGVALFACRARGLREILPLRMPFTNAFVVGDSPFLTPLAGVLADAPPAIVAFVDGTSARLIPVTAEGRGDEVVLHHEVDRRHRRGGWALLAQSRYQRHIQTHRGEHFEAVARALGGETDARGIERLVLAGEDRTLAVFRTHLPPPIAARVVGTVAASRTESASALAARAADVLARHESEEQGRELSAALTEAAKGGRAVAGLHETLDAVERGAVQRLWIIEGFNPSGAVCDACGTLQRGEARPCHTCGARTRAVRLGDAIVERVIAAGGEVRVARAHPDLIRVDGIAARLRYPL